MTATPALTLESLRRTFGALTAVNGVSLAVAPRERRAIIGPNGAGKTTLFNLITGHLAPTAGRILFVSSSVGPRPRTPWGAYAVSKAGVEALMELMAGEAPVTGVLAASINPGGTATAMRAMAYPEEDPATLPSAEAVAGTLLRALRLPGSGFNGQRFTSRDWL